MSDDVDIITNMTIRSISLRVLHFLMKIPIQKNIRKGKYFDRVVEIKYF